MVNKFAGESASTQRILTGKRNLEVNGTASFDWEILGHYYDFETGIKKKIYFQNEGYEEAFMTIRPVQSVAPDDPYDQTAFMILDGTFGLENQIYFHLSAADLFVLPGTHYYDVKIKNDDGTVQEVVKGRITVVGNPTNRAAFM